jgi:RNA polymerase-binding transcription factor DksA
VEGQEQIPGLDPVGGFMTPRKQIPDIAQEYYEGWNDLVARAHAEIVVVDPQYRALQVKTKFGGLRLYLEGMPAIWPIIDKYEQESYTVCELCGKPGSHCKLGYWYATLCPECEAANRPKREAVYNEDLDEE